MIKCQFEDGGQGNLRHTVVHALVEQDGKLLLEKRAANLSEGGKWSLPGGFLQKNESAQQGVLRELHEETGWTGEVVELFRVNSEPHRPNEDRQNIALEFIIKPLKKDGQADKESSEIEWVEIEKLTDLELFAFDHGETIKLYLEYRKAPFKIPLLNPSLSS